MAGPRSVFEKRAEGELVFGIWVSVEKLELRYRLPNAPAFSLTMTTTGRISRLEWTHVALQVCFTSQPVVVVGRCFLGQM